MVNSAPLPRSACSCGSKAVTPLDTETVLASGFLTTMTVIAVLPPTREIEVVSTGCSVTVATSPSRTGPSAVGI